MNNQSEKEKKGYYAIIPATVRYDKSLTANAKLLYGEITALCNEKGYCWASNSYFADLYEVSHRSITRWISDLEEKGYIKVNLQRNKENKAIVEKRQIILVDKIVRSMTKLSNHSRQNCLGSIDKNVQYNNTTNNTNNNNNTVASLDNFNKIWEIYPRKEAKETAYKHYISWINGKEHADTTIQLTNRQIWHAVNKYATKCKEMHTEEKYIKMASTFFGGAIMDYVDFDTDNQDTSNSIIEAGQYSNEEDYF